MCIGKHVSAPIVEFLNWEAYSTHCWRIEEADFCLGDGLSELFNQILDLHGVEGGLLHSWCQNGVPLFILLRATDILKVIFRVVHCFRKCGVPLYDWAGDSGSSAGTNSQLYRSSSKHNAKSDIHTILPSIQW